MATSLDENYYCPYCQRPWRRTAEGWEFIHDKGHHLKEVKVVTCPECEKTMPKESKSS